MKTIIFKKDGTLYLQDKITKEEKKIESIKYYLDCPVKIEEGVTFGTFFKHIIVDKDFLNIVYKETMGESNIDYFLEEWNLPAKPVVKNNGIQYLKAYYVI